MTRNNGASGLVPVPLPSGSVAPLELDAETLERARRLFEEGTPENTKRALRDDAKYLNAWHEARYGAPLTVPASVEAAVTFVVDHVEGPPADVEAALATPRPDPATGRPWRPKRREGSHAMATIERRLATLAALHNARGFPSPTMDFRVRELLRKARIALAARGVRPNKKTAATLDAFLDPMVATCSGGTAADIRDRALLLFAFASGGRRRSEVVSIRIEDVSAVGADYIVKLWRAKTDQEGKGRDLPVKGRAAEALRAWLALLSERGVREGPLFRALTKTGALAVRRRADGAVAPMSGHAVALIVKARAARAGLDPARLSGHSLRSGFVTQSGRDGRQLFETMALTGHADVGVVLGYYQSGDVLNNPAADILDRRRK
jgi:integrase